MEIQREDIAPIASGPLRLRGISALTLVQAASRVLLEAVDFSKGANEAVALLAAALEIGHLQLFAYRGWHAELLASWRAPAGDGTPVEREFGGMGLALPISFQGTLWGCLSLNPKPPGEPWPEETVEILRTIGPVFAQCWIRHSSNLERTLAERSLWAVERASRCLLESADFLTGLEACLRVLGESLGVDRVVVFRYLTEPRPAAQWLAEWHSPDVRSALSIMGREPWDVRLFPEIQADMLAGRVRMRTLAQKTDTDFRVNHEAGTRSDLTIPIFVDGELWGNIGFDDCHIERRWSEAEIQVLRTCALAIAAAWVRDRSEQRSRASMETSSQMLQASIDAVSQATSIPDLMRRLLPAVSARLGGVDTAFFEIFTEEIFLRYWCHRGDVYDPGQLQALDPVRFHLVRELADGFRAIPEYLGRHIAEHIGAVLLNHQEGTAVPRFDEWALGNGWCHEINVGVGGRGRSFGSLVFYAPAERPFSADEVALAEYVGKQVGLAIQAIRGTEERKDEEIDRVNSILVGSISQVAEGEGLDRSLGFVVERIGSTLGPFYVALLRYDQQSDRLGLAVASHEGEVRYGLDGSVLPLFAQPFPARLLPAWDSATEIFAGRTPGPFVHRDYPWPGPPEWMRAEGITGITHLALRAGDRPVGALALFFRNGEQLSAADMPLLSRFGQQVSLALRFAELADAAGQAALAASRQQVAESRAAGLASVNATINESIRRLADSKIEDAVAVVIEQFSRSLGAAVSHWFDYDEDSRTFTTVVRCSDGVITTEIEPDEPEYLRRPFSGEIWPMFEDMMAVDEVHVLDVTSPAWFAWPETTHWHAAHGRTRALAYAVRAGNRCLGVLGMAFRPRPDLTPAELGMVRSCAHQIALASQMAALAGEARQAAVAREREQTMQVRIATLDRYNQALRDAASALGGSGVEDFFGFLLGAAVRAASANGGVIVEYLPASDTLLTLANTRSPNRPNSYPLQFPRVFPASSHPGWPEISSSPGPVLTSLEEARGRLRPDAFDWHKQIGHQGILTCPTRLGDRVTGYLGLAFKNMEDMSEGGLQIVMAFAHQAAVAMELRSLGEKARDAAVAEERNRLAREIHDTLAQGYAGILAQLGAASQAPGQDRRVLDPFLRRMEALARENLIEARRSVDALRPRPEPVFLEAPVRQLIEQAAGRSTVPIFLREHGPSFPVPAIVSSEILRIAQESILNSVQHSQCSVIQVHLDFEEGRAVRLAIQDDGKGFDTEQAPIPGHYGLLGMQERAERISAVLTIVSEPGRGTETILHWRANEPT